MPRWVVKTETVWSAKPKCLLSGPFQKTLAIPAPEHVSLATTLISYSWTLISVWSQHPASLSWKMFQMWLSSYLHCNCLSSGSCELRLGDKISCSVSSVLPSQAFDSFYTEASHPFPHHSTCRKGSICTRHWSKWTWLLGGWRWLAQSNRVFLKSNSVYKCAHYLDTLMIPFLWHTSAGSSSLHCCQSSTSKTHTWPWCVPTSKPSEAPCYLNYEFQTPWFGINFLS